jgi:phosphatidylglycerophosphate synthase
MNIKKNKTDKDKNKQNISMYGYTYDEISPIVGFLAIIILFVIVYFLLKSWKLRKTCDAVRPNGWTKNVSILFVVLIVLVILPTRLSNVALIVLIVLYFQWRDDCVDTKISTIKNMLSKHF